MSLSDAKVEVTLADIDTLRSRVKESEKRAVAAERALAKSKIDGDDGTGRAYFNAFHDAMKIAQFVIGNLEPRTVRGWPYERVYKVAQVIRALPGVDPDLIDIATDLRMFADEAKRWEDARAKGIEQELHAEETAARGGVVIPDPMPAGPGIESPAGGPV